MIKMKNVYDEETQKIESKIWELEEELDKLRLEYKKKTGNTPKRKFSNYDWKWSIFMLMGYQFITCMF